ncbi:MAG: DNA-binding protein [Alphaproteobacteria bacterium]|nr:DNA-binding protein [Alphaproteobacteria bacterium]
MPSHAATFVGLSDRDRKTLSPLPKLTDGDRVELHVRGRDGADCIVVLPPVAISAVEEVVGRLLDGESVAVLSQDQELSPTEASVILGISKPLVVLQMDRGDLPFRYVGKHRRALLKDILTLKVELDRRQKAMEDLADEAEDLHLRYGI